MGAAVGGGGEKIVHLQREIPDVEIHLLVLLLGTSPVLNLLLREIVDVGPVKII